eukprot:Colp12_sorted_trinity150504_noHs@5605
MSVTTVHAKNKSGLDMSVPTVGDAIDESGKAYKEYKILLRTNLTLFKKPTNRVDETIQFGVGRRYNAFHEMYQKLKTTFPDQVSVKLLHFPRHVTRRDAYPHRYIISGFTGTSWKDNVLPHNRQRHRGQTCGL